MEKTTGIRFKDLTDLLRPETEKLRYLDIEYKEFNTKIPGFIVIAAKYQSGKLLGLGYEELTQEELEEYGFDRLFKYRKKFLFKVPIEVLIKRKDKRF